MTAPRSICKTIWLWYEFPHNKPARPWFRLATANKKLMERADVKEYLRAVEDRMYQILNQSNFYTQAALLYLEIGVFGTAVMHIKEDFKDIVRFHTYTIGNIISEPIIVEWWMFYIGEYLKQRRN